MASFLIFGGRDPLLFTVLGLLVLFFVLLVLLIFVLGGLQKQSWLQLIPRVAQAATKKAPPIFFARPYGASEAILQEAQEEALGRCSAQSVALDGKASSEGFGL